MAKGYSLGGLIKALGSAAFLNVGKGTGQVAAGDDSRIVNALQKGSNLRDVADAEAARTNLGLKEAAKRAVGTGAGQIPDMSAFEYVGNASAGYLKLPNGFKLQWLETPGRVPASSAGAGYWSYPFSVCLFAIAVPVAVTANATAGNVVAGAFSNVAVELHNWGPISAPARILGVGR